jgi:hypothetical protein
MGTIHSFEPELNDPAVAELAGKKHGFNSANPIQTFFLERQCLLSMTI